MNRKRKLKKRQMLVLAAVALVTAVCGIWLLISPSLERGYVFAAQESLLDDLLLDIQGANVPPDEVEGLDELPGAEDVAAVYMDYAEAETQAADNHCIYSLDGYITDYNYHCEYAICEPIHALYYEPVPDNAFPNAIIGIGILTIDSVNLHLPIAEGVDEATLRIAPGRVPQTANIGDIGNAVIAGHRNYAFGSMFNRLGELVLGDIVQYQARCGEMMEFEVFEIAVIEPHDQVAFLQPVNDSIITLYTCTPTRTATHRLIIRAQRIS